jgi:hypothetical protein
MVAYRDFPLRDNRTAVGAADSNRRQAGGFDSLECIFCDGRHTVRFGP